MRHSVKEEIKLIIQKNDEILEKLETMKSKLLMRQAYCKLIRLKQIRKKYNELQDEMKAIQGEWQ